MVIILTHLFGHTPRAVFNKKEIPAVEAADYGLYLPLLEMHFPTSCLSGQFGSLPSGFLSFSAIVGRNFSPGFGFPFQQGVRDFVGGQPFFGAVNQFKNLCVPFGWCQFGIAPPFFYPTLGSN
jgi:hypothetical protein